jgi:hypothetical protein
MYNFLLFFFSGSLTAPEVPAWRLHFTSFSNWQIYHIFTPVSAAREELKNKTPKAKEYYDERCK